MGVTRIIKGQTVGAVAPDAAVITIDIASGIANTAAWQGDVLVIEGVNGTPYNLQFDNTGTKYSGESTGVSNTYYLDISANSEFGNTSFPIDSNNATGILALVVELKKALIDEIGIAKPLSGLSSVTFSTDIAAGTISIHLPAHFGVSGNSTQNSALLLSDVTFSNWANGTDPVINDVSKDIENTQHMQSLKMIHTTTLGAHTPSVGDVFTRVKAIGMDLGMHCGILVEGLDGEPHGPFNIEEGDVLDGPFVKVTLSAGTGTPGNISPTPSIALWERT